MLGDKGFEPMNTVIIIRKLNQIQMQPATNSLILNFNFIALIINFLN